jgi:hypothetical protein
MAGKAKKDPLPELVDELGDLEAELGPLRGKIQRLAIVRAAVRDAFTGRPPLESFSASGERYTAHLGACGSESTIDLARLADAIGYDALLQICNVSLRTLEAACEPAIFAAVVKTG